MKFLDCFHILNPNKTRRSAVTRFFRDKPASSFCWVERTSHPTHLETVVEFAVNAGAKKIAVWGGDGTYNRVIQALATLNALNRTTLILIPVGTANDFARRIGLGDWRKTVSSLFDDKEKERIFDLGLVEAASVRRIFVNNSGFGRAPEALLRHRSNPLNDIAGFSEKRLKLEWTSGKIKEFEVLRAFFGIVFNAPYFNNGMYFAEDIHPDDGVLNAFFVPPENKALLGLRLLKSRLGGSLANAATRRIDGKSIVLESDADLYLQADGEAVGSGAVRWARYSVMKDALSMRVPYNAGSEHR